MGKDPRNTILTSNQVFYKFIFSIMGFFGIGISYILRFQHDTWMIDFDIWKILFASFGISIPFIFLGIVSVFLLRLIVFRGKKSKKNTIQNRMVQDISIVSAFIAAIVIYAFFGEIIIKVVFGF